MEALFATILNMSCQAAVVMLFVLAARLLAGAARVPKKYCCMLWAIPFVRMVCPVAIESVLSLLPRRELLFSRYPAEGLANEGTVPGAASTFQWLTVLGMIWAAGVVLFLAYSVISFLKLRRKLCCSLHLQDNIYLADYIQTPFVLGLIKPRIYVPSAITQEESGYILAHEQMHIRRRDYLYKLAAFLIVGLHWFNPFAWAAYFLLCRDMEMACDEAVMQHYGEGCREEYAQTLLEYAAGRKLRGVPLAFSEGNPKGRIQNIMRYKKPLMGVSIVAVIALAVLAIGLLSNPVSEKQEESSGGGEDIASSQAEESDSDWPKNVAITAPMLEADMPLGADNMILDYADDNVVIFHGYFGLFVFDKTSRGLRGAVDLKAIGCDATQGDNYCEVTVQADGTKVYLAPIVHNMMYVYDVMAGSLTMESYDISGIEMFDSFKPERDFLEEYIGVRSENRVALEGNDGNVRYGYLSSATGTVLDITYEEICYEDGDYVYESYPVFLLYLENRAGEIGQMVDSHSDEIQQMQQEANALLSSSRYAMCVNAAWETGIQVEIFNNTDERICYSDDYKLQKWNGKEWEDVPYVIDNWAFNQPAYPVEAGTSRQESIDWEWLYGKLPDGIYLLVKSVSIEKADDAWEHISLGVEFTLPVQQETAAVERQRIN